jgi:hypothetical protein
MEDEAVELQEINLKIYSEAPPPLYGRGGRVVRLKHKLWQTYQQISSA